MFNLWHSVTVECIIGRPATVVVVGDDERENDDRIMGLAEVEIQLFCAMFHHSFTSIVRNNDVRFSFQHKIRR